jgi:hypothetical protein
MKKANLLRVFLVYAICSTMIACAPAFAVTLTFDDIPEGQIDLQYWDKYGIWFGSGFSAVDHTGSEWGPPRSGSNVLVWTLPPPGKAMMYTSLSKDPPIRARTVGGYFSTQPGVSLELIGYTRSTSDPPVASVVIGNTGQSWTNVYAELSSNEGIGFVEFRPLTEDALLRFCADDITVAWIPEPSSLLALFGGLAGLGGMRLRRRR